jgi:hypothetical protein
MLRRNSIKPTYYGGFSQEEVIKQLSNLTLEQLYAKKHEYAQKMNNGYADKAYYGYFQLIKQAIYKKEDMLITV